MSTAQGQGGLDPAGVTSSSHHVFFLPQTEDPEDLLPLLPASS